MPAPTLDTPEQAQAVKDVGTKFASPVPPGLSPSQQAAYLGVQNAFAPDSSVTSSSGTLPLEERKLGSDITNQSAPTYNSPASNDYISKIDAQIAALEQRRKDEEARIQDQFDVLRQSTERQQTSETGSTSAGLARAGGYLGYSGSGTGVLLNLAQTHRNEMSALESKRQAALAEARNAYTDKQFALAQLKATEAKAVEKEAYDRQQTYAKQLATANEAIKKKNDEVNIYNAIAGGKTDPLDIFKELGGNTSMEDINNFLTKSTPKDKNGDFAYTTAQTAKLLGSGLGIKDIKAAQDYINVHGYDDAFRSQLSPAQKVAFDNVYRERAAGVTPEKPLNVLDIQRYNDLYPDAGVVAGDTESIANEKVNKSNSPDVKLMKQITEFKAAGESYERVAQDIQESATIQDKEKALLIAKEVYGVADSSKEEVINASNINQYKVVNGKLVKDLNYIPTQPPDTISAPQFDPFRFISQIGDFLWKVGK